MWYLKTSDSQRGSRRNAGAQSYAQVSRSPQVWNNNHYSHSQLDELPSLWPLKLCHRCPWQFWEIPGGKTVQTGSSPRTISVRNKEPLHVLYLQNAVATYHHRMEVNRLIVWSQQWEWQRCAKSSGQQELESVIWTSIKWRAVGQPPISNWCLEFSNTKKNFVFSWGRKMQACWDGIWWKAASLEFSYQAHILQDQTPMYDQTQWEENP